jgi:glucose/arabinose dehydrogenase
LQFYLLICLASIGIFIVAYFFGYGLYSTLLYNQQEQERQKQDPSLRIPERNALKVQEVTGGLASPTSMAFLDGNNILVLEKNGQVRLISNGILQKQPILTLSVNTTAERGLLGIATLRRYDGSSNSNNHHIDNPNAIKSDINTSKKIVNKKAATTTTTTTKTISATTSNITHSEVFLYFTESKAGEPLRNRVYRYDWNEQKHLLFNPDLLLDLPAAPGPYHNGGKIVIGPDHYLYVVIGNLNTGDGLLQNNKHGKEPDDTSVILRIKPSDGSAAPKNPFINNTNSAMHKYYAYGIRNSFGMTFDPITGYIWDTENGEATYDEVNLVKPGFNSGWYQVMGPMSRSNVTERNLVNFRGSHYSDPVFSWYNCIGVTGIEFLKSSKLGQKYMNNIFVGDINNGNLYYFELNKTRTGFRFDPNTQSALTDHVADNKDEVSEITFGTGFGGITDIKTGPDGYLYILSYGNGCLYRIGPAQQ